MIGEREGDFGESEKSVWSAGVFLSFCGGGMISAGRCGGAGDLVIIFFSWVVAGEVFAVGNVFLVLILGLAVWGVFSPPLWMSPHYPFFSLNLQRCP